MRLASSCFYFVCYYGECRSDDFRCHDGSCIPFYQKCDMVADCNGGEDEHNCSKDDERTCSPNDHVCQDGSCIDSTRVCDSVPDCKDGSDERSCSIVAVRHLCETRDQFLCGSGACVPVADRCDGKVDCPKDADDEIGCSCHVGQWQCDDGTCLEDHLKCDGKVDCPRDSSDETNDWCRKPCRDGSEEDGGEFMCLESGKCIPAKLRCNGAIDCPDKSDELKCSCRREYFKCFNGHCIPPQRRCDGTRDCQDGSDEYLCGSECTQDQLKCRDGGCYFKNQTCNKVRDCNDGTDEHNCNYCGSEQFRCYDGKCLSASRRCDNRRDCSEGEDELHCTGSEGGVGSAACSSDEFTCTVDGSCVASYRQCDGKRDCPSGEDEAQCTSPESGSDPNANICLPSEFRCANGICITETFRCDGISDCTDKSDEENCREVCGPGDIICGDGTCVREQKKCDGTEDCSDGADERGCEKSCSWSEFECASGECIPAYRRCNNRPECRDGSDELGCGTTTTTTTYAPPTPGSGCLAWEFRCLSGRRECVPREALCDGHSDCDDRSDEENCSGNPELILKTYPPEQTIKESREVVFQCRDEGYGHIPVRWVREGNQPLPPSSRDHNGRLEMPNIQISHSGTYYCEAIGVPLSTPGSRVPVYLKVEPLRRWPNRTLDANFPQFKFGVLSQSELELYGAVILPTAATPGCGPDEATCYNRECIPKSHVCDGKYDCGDGSDETRCSPWGCEPNEFRCDNKKCVRKSWRCDSDDDCGDGSDERDCAKPQVPGSRCNANEFECKSRDQCIPKWFHCDSQTDCQDSSDEIGCFALSIDQPPPPMVTLNVGETFNISCVATGVPTPVVSWRLNWGHIPPKCITSSVNGIGVLTCHDIQESDQGAYSCEAMDLRHSIIAQPDTHLEVRPIESGQCPAGTFNELAKSSSECIKCFCFGATVDCKSANLFIYQLQPPLYPFRFVNVHVVPQRSVDIRRDEPSPVQSFVRALSDQGFELNSRSRSMTRDNEGVYPYFAMPENYHGNQLKSYGGYINYKVRADGPGQVLNIPDIILNGNGFTLVYVNREVIRPGRTNDVSVHLFEGEWRHVTGDRWTYATREDIMMALVNVENILIRTQYLRGPGIQTEITGLQMDSAAISNAGLGKAAYVEECRCPAGYSGLSCEECAPGYLRRTGAQQQWLGKCYREEEKCPQGEYGDPQRGISCRPCPCPLTTPSNQFGRTCRLDSDGDVTCDCPSGYIGRRCDRCASGFSGNPLLPGDYCRRGQCDPAGSKSPFPDPSTGRCICKESITGPTCNQCKANTFLLSSANRYGCTSCFCMGVTDDCFSSNLYRDQVKSVFTRDTQDFKLVSADDPSIELPVNFDPSDKQISYDSFEPKVYYWLLPTRFLNNKVTSYGGNLTYTFRSVPTPGGQSSKNTAADVIIKSLNGIQLSHYSVAYTEPDRPMTVSVLLTEDHWQREDGAFANREHLLMALADLSDIMIKATYTTNTRHAALTSVSLDTATERNTGLSRAAEVEKCRCPEGYQGSSCEDCIAGYTRADYGLYLGICEPCNCTGHSSECHPDTGVCSDCRDNTQGDNCEECLPGYIKQGDRCIPGGGTGLCVCDPRGSLSSDCSRGVCQCKVNVMGDECDECRPGTFNLLESSPDGCTQCFCSGVTTYCKPSNLYIEQIPVLIIDKNHGFTLTDSNRTEVIREDFILNFASNEIGYDLSNKRHHRFFWSLPSQFTGDKVTSYGGKLTFTQKFAGPYDASVTRDSDVIISGNGISLFTTHDETMSANKAKTFMVHFSEDKWRRLDARSGQPRASREDLMTVLSNIDAIMVRASLSPDSSMTFLSDVTMDTAVPQRIGVPATQVEVCRCPPEYKGTSCELCADHYYKDFDRLCKPCPCSNNEESCSLGPDYRVNCICRQGYSGVACQETDEPNEETSTAVPPPTPTIIVSISDPNIQIVEAGSTVRFRCTATTAVGRPLQVRWSREGGVLPPNRAVDDRNGVLVMMQVRESDSGVYVCTATDGYTSHSETATLTVGGSRYTPPEVRILPSSVDSREGDSVDIRCEATGNPTPSVTWRRTNNATINPQAQIFGGLLRFPSISLNDYGTYECLGTNQAGTQNQYVNVYIRERDNGPPETVDIEVAPRRFSGLTGETVQLYCRILSNYDKYRLLWSREGNRPLPYKANQRDGILTILDSEVSDSGQYICSATDPTTGLKVAEVSVAVDIQIYRRPPSVKLEPESQTAAQGSRAELRCLVTGSSPGDRPRIRWIKANDQLPAYVHTTDTSLVIPSVMPSDRGVYACIAESSGGSAQASAIIEVERREPPSVELYPSAQQVLSEGNALFLQCRAVAGIPPPKLYWSRPNNESLPYSVQELHNGVLKFNSVRASDAGEYICHAENAAGTVKMTAVVVVHRAPDVEVIPRGTVTLLPGEKLHLKCSATGEPEPTVTWNTPRPRVRGYGSWDKHPEAEYEVYSVSREDEGTYTCVAENEAGRKEVRVQVIVNDNEVNLPHRGDIPSFDNDPVTPEVTTSHREFTVPLGGNSEMVCSPQGWDERGVRLEWHRRDGRPLGSEVEQRGRVLYVRNAQRSTEGEYSCVGILESTNAILFSHGWRLRVIAAPRITLNPTRQVVRPGEDAYVQCSVDGDQPIEITWEAVGRALPSSVTVSEGYLQFRGITDSDAGKYVCKASNRAGEAEAAAEVIVNERDTRRPLVTVVDRNQNVFEGSNVMLQCTTSVPVELEWTREGGDLPVNAVSDGNSLRLDYVRPEDSGRYYCRTKSTWTGGAQGSDYVDLYVTRGLGGCSWDEFRCVDGGECLPDVYRCDGFAHCTDGSDEWRCPSGSAWWRRQSRGTTDVSVKIQPSIDVIRVGDNVDLRCVARGLPASQVHWSKLNDRLPSNVQVSTNLLRISDVTTANAGIYRCSARTSSGYLEDDYILNVQGYSPPLSDDAEAIETKRASVGQTAILSCNTDLERPVSYSWSKRDAPLPKHSSSYFETLTIPNVTLADAGMYICTASNGEVRMDIPTILTVTGAIPSFAQAPLSYIALTQLLDAYLGFNIELIIKPEHKDGLILYKGQQTDGGGDFVSFGLRDGIPEFRFNVGSGPAIISSGEPLQMGTWHHIKLNRDRREGFMWVNDVGPYTGSSSGRYQGLDLVQPLYIGSVPDFNKIHSLAGFNTGFIGCISKVNVGEGDDLSQKNSLEWVGVTTCETCSERAGNPCTNNGVCQEAVNNVGYVCICPRGFSGVNCTQAGEPCYPGACGSGHCRMTPPGGSSGIHCDCPLGKAGSRCEHDVHITNPMFRNNAYIAYPTPRSGADRMKMMLKVNAADDSDGLLLYSGQTSSGQGHFVSLAIKDRRFEFKFDTGVGGYTSLGPVTLTSNIDVVPDEWVAVTANRDSRMATLTVGTDVVHMTLTPSQRQGLNLRTPLYMGGHDKSVTLNSAVRVDKGFEGCISQIEVYGMQLDLLRSAMNASNVGQCHLSHSDPCSSSPCHNGGECTPPKRPGHRYTCECPAGFGGANCEVETDLCEEITPCENGGTCIPQRRGYTCNCPMGFAGEECEQTIEIGYDVSLSGDGYVEMSKDLLPHTEVDAREVIEMDITTSSPDGILFWHGQSLQHDSTKEPDYFAIAIVDGEVEVSYELGSGPGKVRVPHRVDDGKRHHVAVTREGSDATVVIDSIYQEQAHSQGVLTQLNAKGNIYIGGSPNNDFMTDGRYQHGFTGCIHKLRIQDSGDIEFGSIALSSVNALSCTNQPRNNDVDENYDEDDDDEENGEEDYYREPANGRQPVVN